MLLEHAANTKTTCTNTSSTSSPLLAVTRTVAGTIHARGVGAEGVGKPEMTDQLDPLIKRIASIRYCTEDVKKLRTPSFVSELAGIIQTCNSHKDEETHEQTRNRLPIHC